MGVTSLFGDTHKRTVIALTVPLLTVLATSPLQTPDPPNNPVKPPLMTCTVLKTYNPLCDTAYRGARGTSMPADLAWHSLI